MVSYKNGLTFWFLISTRAKFGSNICMRRSNDLSKRLHLQAVGFQFGDFQQTQGLAGSANNWSAGVILRAQINPPKEVVL